MYTLADYLKEKTSQPVVLINEESLSVSKSSGYCNEASEKKLRGACFISIYFMPLKKHDEITFLLYFYGIGSLRSAVDHALNPQTYVILDSLNYIKGYRYEIYCIRLTYRPAYSVPVYHLLYAVCIRYVVVRSGLLTVW